MNILFLAGIDINAQTIDETIKNGDELYKSGDYFNSLKCYQRALFFLKNKTYELYEKIADNYLNMREYDQAEAFYDSALTKTIVSESVINIMYKKLDCIILSKNFERGIKYAKKTKLAIDRDSLKFNFYMGVLYFGNENYELSESFFLQAVCDTCSFAKDQINELFSTNLDIPDPRTAEILSSVLPGLGQLYAGDYKNALNSFVLIGIIVFVSCDMYSSFGIADPLISIFPWFNRYFQGGIHNAGVSAERMRDNIRNDVLNQLIRISEDNSNFGNE